MCSCYVTYKKFFTILYIIFPILCRTSIFGFCTMSTIFRPRERTSSSRCVYEKVAPIFAVRLTWHREPREVFVAGAGERRGRWCSGDDSHYGITTAPAAKRVVDRRAARPAAAATASPPRRPQNCRWKRRGIPIRASRRRGAHKPFNPAGIYTFCDRTAARNARNYVGKQQREKGQGSGND